MNSKILCMAFVLGLSSPLALAEDDDDDKRAPDYSFIEFTSIGYDMDFGGIDVEPDGYELKLSLALGDSLFGVIDRSNSDGNFAGANYDFDTEGYGFGLRGDSWFASYTYNT